MFKREIRISLGGRTKEFEAYQETYNREFDRYRRRSSMAELIEAVLGADIVYNGDYHTMAQSQRIPLRILREVVRRRKVILALEVVHIDQQPKLDLFMDGALSEDGFLHAIEYDRRWGFSWEHYRDLFLFAREQGMRVVGINSEPGKDRGRLRRRDRAAAKVIAAEHLNGSGSLVYVFDGDLHVTPQHLPREVDSILADSGQQAGRVVVYQNNEKIYWKLAARGLERETDVVLISKGKYCVMSTPPIIKFQSYFNWIDNCRELTSPTPQNWRTGLAGEEDLYSQVLRLVRMISSFLAIEGEGFEDFAVHSTAELDFLDRLRARGKLSAEDVEVIAAHIRTNESYYIEEGNILYIANLSINHVAEEATHFIHKVCAGPRRRDLTQIEDFYCRTMREAIGFFGSKLVNHKRPCYGEEDFRNLKGKGPAKRPERIRELRRIGKFVCEHKRKERAFFDRNGLWTLEGPIYRQPLKIHIGITHALGYMLGNRLFEGLMDGEVGKDYIRVLFFMNFSDIEQSLSTYLEALSMLSRVNSPAP